MGIFNVPSDHIGRQHIAGNLADFAVIRGEIEGGKISGGGRVALQLRGRQAALRRLVIGAQRVRALQAGFQIGDGKSLVRSFVGQFEFLAGRQSNHARQRKFLFGKIVRGGNQLLLARLVFDLGAQRVNRRSDAGLLLRHRLVVERMRRFDLRLRGFHAGGSGNGLQVSVAGREHDQIARVLQVELGHAFADRGRTVFLDCLPVEHALRCRGAHVKVGERPDNARQSPDPGKARSGLPLPGSFSSWPPAHPH